MREKKIHREGKFFLVLVLGKPFDCHVDENFQLLFVKRIKVHVN